MRAKLTTSFPNTIAIGFCHCFSHYDVISNFSPCTTQTWLRERGNFENQTHRHHRHHQNHHHHHHQLHHHPNSNYNAIQALPKFLATLQDFPRGMENDTCFKCHQQGHWYRNCPLNSSNANHDSQYPQIWCHCGHGYCVVKTSKNGGGKKYYACPIIRGKKCGENGFIKWCNEVEDSDFIEPPAYKYPECKCRAGVCRKMKQTENPYASEWYFTCPVPEGHGSCRYVLWENELLNSKSIVSIQPSSQITHGFLEGYQNDESNHDLGLGGDLLVKHSKRMRMMGNSENHSSIDVSEPPESEDASQKASPSKCFGFPEFEVANYQQDLDFASSVPWDDYEEEPSQLSQPSTPPRSEDASEKISRAQCHGMIMRRNHLNYLNHQHLQGVKMHQKR